MIRCSSVRPLVTDFEHSDSALHQFDFIVVQLSRCREAMELQIAAVELLAQLRVRVVTLSKLAGGLVGQLSCNGPQQKDSQGKGEPAAMPSAGACNASLYRG